MKTTGSMEAVRVIMKVVYGPRKSQDLLIPPGMFMFMPKKAPMTVAGIEKGKQATQRTETLHLSRQNYYSLYCLLSRPLCSPSLHLASSREALSVNSHGSPMSILPT